MAALPVKAALVPFRAASAPLPISAATTAVLDSAMWLRYDRTHRNVEWNGMESGLIGTMGRADEPRDELAEVPPHGFVKARDALVARLRQEGDTAAAKAVSAMKRPPVTVWAVNRLAREAADTVEELIESADRMKQAQLGHGGATG